ncbi:RcpC/CpaB family pilus assembly protein [Elusimicrobiota bacterium]
MTSKRWSDPSTLFALSLLLVGAVFQPAHANKGLPPTGYRAMTLTLDQDQVRFIKPGQHVDVLVTFDALMKSDVKEKVTATILQNVLVLDVGKSEEKGKGFLLLVLNPNESQYLALSIDANYKLRVAHRNMGDTKMKPLEMASFRKLFR